MTEGTPAWYEPGDVPATLRAAHRTGDVGVGLVVDLLSSREFDAPRERVADLVAATPDEFDDAADTSDRPSTEEPRPGQPRYVDREEVTYLSSREFAAVLGAALSRYEGEFQTPAAVDDVEVDLFWTRTHTTVALRTVSNDPDDVVDEETVSRVAEGDTSPRSGRSPSTVGVVTNTGFTNAAEERAEESAIELYDGSYVGQWFRDTRLPPEVLGELLDEEYDTDTDRKALFEALPPLPESVEGRDPLESAGTTVRVDLAGDDGGSRGGTTPIPVVNTPFDPGQTGVLYADHREDGDFGAFDDFVDDLDTGGGSQ